MGLAIVLTLTIMAFTASCVFFGREMLKDIRKEKVSSKILGSFAALWMIIMVTGFVLLASGLLVIAMDDPQTYQTEIAWAREYDQVVYDGEQGKYICKDFAGTDEVIHVSRKYIELEYGSDKVEVEKHHGMSPWLRIDTDYYVLKLPDDYKIVYIDKEAE